MTCKNNLGLTRRNVFHDQDLVYTSEEFCFSGMIFSYAIASWPSGQRRILSRIQTAWKQSPWRFKLEKKVIFAHGNMGAAASKNRFSWSDITRLFLKLFKFISSKDHISRRGKNFEWSCPAKFSLLRKQMAKKKEQMKLLNYIISNHLIYWPVLLNTPGMSNKENKLLKEKLKWKK